MKHDRCGCRRTCTGMPVRIAGSRSPMGRPLLDRTQRLRSRSPAPLSHRSGPRRCNLGSPRVPTGGGDRAQCSSPLQRLLAHRLHLRHRRRSRVQRLRPQLPGEPDGASGEDRRRHRGECAFSGGQHGSSPQRSTAISGKRKDQSAYQTQPYCWGSPQWTESRGVNVARSVNPTSFIPTVTNSVPIASERCSGFQQLPWS